MNNFIKCPHCGKQFEAEEVLTHQITEQVSKELEVKHKAELDEARKKAEAEITLSVGRDLESEKERNKKLSSQLDELIDETRKLRQKDAERELEMKKKLLDEEEKIKAEARRKFEEEHMLTDLQKNKKYEEALTQIQILRDKLEKGSQQTQGEVLELEIENNLRSEFPEDRITEVKKGQRGADVTQIVVDKLGRSCGIILWESKNAQWSDTWIPKLKEDQRQAKADIAVLISVNMPDNNDNLIYKDGVWVCSWKSYIAVAKTLRYALVSVNHERVSSEGKDEKMKILYQYLTGPEFKNRVEGIVDAFDSLRDELDKEKRFFNTKWARQEKEIGRVIDHTHGMWGDLQSVVGKSLPEIKSLELQSGDGLN